MLNKERKFNMITLNKVLQGYVVLEESDGVLDWRVVKEVPEDQQDMFNSELIGLAKQVREHNRKVVHNKLFTLLELVHAQGWEITKPDKDGTFMVQSESLQDLVETGDVEEGTYESDQQDVVNLLLAVINNIT